ncbi:MAG: hypothetical protein KDC53_02980 [Saprospiraceae bacterium]|nr:hypothetical protein [Saprospiraceae bacterium]
MIKARQTIWFLIFITPLVAGGQTILKTTTKGQYIRMSIPVSTWQGKIKAPSPLVTGFRLAIGLNEAVEIFGELKLNKIKTHHKDLMLSGGKLALGTRYNFFKPLEFLKPGYQISATFFDQFHINHQKEKIGYYFLIKKSGQNSLMGTGFTYRILPKLSIGLDSTIKWNKSLNIDYSEINQSRIPKSFWLGIVFIHHLL